MKGSRIAFRCRWVGAYSCLSLWERWPSAARPERALRHLPSQSALRLPASGPGRNYKLLPALAKNMPPAYF